MRNRGQFFAVVMLTVALALLAGCSRKQRTDAEVATDVQTTIYSDSAIESRQIGVQAADGVVTLSGDVTSDTERTTAAKDAASVAGVKTVVNNLEVQQAQSAIIQQKPNRAKNDTQAKSRHHNKSNDSENDIDPSTLPPAPPVTEPAPAAQAAPPPPPPPPQKVTVPAGTQLSVRLNDSLVGSSRVDLQACKLEYSIVSPK